MTYQRKGRWLMACAATLSALVVLTGCEAPFEDSPPVDLTLGLADGGLVAAANCDVSASGVVRVWIGESSEDGFYDFFIAERDEGWPAGEVLTVGVDEWSRVETSETPLLAADAHLRIHIVTESGGYVARFTIPKRGLQEGAWLHTDGELTHEPCG